MNLSLVVLQGQAAGKEIPIRLTQFLIGRDPECHLRPATPLVSKRHCAVLVRDDKAFLRDFESTNGTFVNGKPLKGEAELRHGDEIKVASLAFKVKLDVPVTTSKPAPVAVGAGAKTPAPTRPTPAKVAARAENSGADVDEESVAEMLLNLNDDPALAGRNFGSEKIPGGSTIMEVLKSPDAPTPPPDAASGEEDPGTKKKETKKLVIDPAATSNAAKAILEKYMRRPRT